MQSSQLLLSKSMTMKHKIHHYLIKSINDTAINFPCKTEKRLRKVLSDIVPAFTPKKDVRIYKCFDVTKQFKIN